MAMRTDDITGAQTSTKGLGVFSHHQRRQYNETNNTADIFGAKSGTLKKGPTTQRVSNPLSPDYQFLGRDDLDNKLNPYSVSKKEKVTADAAQKEAQK